MTRWARLKLFFHKMLCAADRHVPKQWWRHGAGDEMERVPEEEVQFAEAHGIVPEAWRLKCGGPCGQWLREPLQEGPDTIRLTRVVKQQPTDRQRGRL